MASAAGYRRATRHPWPCLLFVLPLLAGYEFGVIWLSDGDSETLRNGADLWVRCWLTALHQALLWVPPALLVLVFLIWTGCRWGDRPGQMIGTLSGMLLESVGYALGLWGLARALAPLLHRVGVALATGETGEAGLRLTVHYLGSGIYEEAIFRLFLFSMLLWVLRRFDLREGIASLSAGIASALLFSAAHYWGPYGEEYSTYSFLFRLVAGLYFAWLFRARGFGVAVGSHVCFNLMVSLGAT